MCNFDVIAGGYKAYSQYQEGLAQKNYYDYLAQNSRTEAEYALQVAGQQETMVQDKAAQEGKQQKISAAKLNAAQRVALAENGIGLDSVTAQDITENSFSNQQLDEQMIRYNADLQGWQIRTEGLYKNWAANAQALQYSMAGKNAKAAGKREAIGTLLSTAAQVQKQATQAAAGGA